MGSLGSAEILVIAVAALIVFGPKRLPEIARKASQLLVKTREATQSVTSALDSEFDGVTAPLQTLRSEYNATMKEIKGAATSVGDAATSAGDPSKTKSDATKPGEDLSVAMPLDDELPAEGAETTLADDSPIADLSVAMPLDDDLPEEMEPKSHEDDESVTGARTSVLDETSDGEDSTS